MAQLNTAQYEAAHGKSPRGKGNWWLTITFTDGEGRYSSETVNGYGTLSEVKARAWRQIKSMVGGAKSIVEVEVLP